jgi:hypothetical protein
MGNMKESNQQMERFASMRPSDDRATEFRKNPDYLTKNFRTRQKV